LHHSEVRRFEYLDSHDSSTGDPEQIHLEGQSAGAHVVHQLLHYAARQAPAKAPFITALLMSNAIVANPVDPATKNDQFRQLCAALAVDPDRPDVLDVLRDTSKVSTSQLIEAVQCMGASGTFRGVFGSDGWVRSDEMEYQYSGGLARGLRSVGVKCVIVGDLLDEVSSPSQLYTCI
jgi:carboxylesterase type B